MQFGKWLHDKRKEKRLTQGELAAKAGISTSYVSTLEREQPHGITNANPQPTAEVVESLARVLDQDVDEARTLAGYAGSPKQPENVRELILSLQALGIVDHIEMFEDDDRLKNGNLDDIKDDIMLVIERSIRKR